MILFINTTDREKAILAIIGKTRLLAKTVFAPRARLSESLPFKLQSLLKKANLSFSDIKKIAVVRGPGSFVGSRTGVATANALAFTGKTPIVGLTEQEIPANLADLNKLKYKKTIITPKYAAPPNITMPRSKAKR
ncbi:MAG: tRNA (adenosine(37)-N6)-threonylcarbamoyltransferase complex dimerization subunit type 1 TsaB [Candidatus Doudnabacteria bacterium RIFCSPHIGHO2_02_FULL_46_11]|uniref:tRNA (Adenosine(37)-N6)-threonylcarbamoyltransferase complex dimerization subunit type 1 TsaB n=1 Tax=Candidatus Doudnabacteria bacterium RIFCSPHIGHO2_02_FULL_46_11 TaxID=1817832 RepID=A0A1F5P7P7_9BACT|nr:MAG: tRNA (adenosine(37)-N6)-threonylcarbamoyltransferase complex dimerization subunit type 1 TsaB [Candidatus Doudnabacteria bacterium RIFCSPHIGHO2_02_FULL_46_11]